MIGIGKGMVTTLKQMLRPSITEQYPTVRPELPERARMGFAMALKDDGAAKCTACMLCERSCPDDAIKIEAVKNPAGKGRVLTDFKIDLGRCMYCGLCVEQCTSDGLHHTGEFEHSVTKREDTIIVLYHAEPPEAPPMQEVTEAQLAEVTETFGHVHPSGKATDGPEPMAVAEPAEDGEDA
jgi:NADH-quinone oxidoreductase subunit I